VVIAGTLAVFPAVEAGSLLRLTAPLAVVGVLLVILAVVWLGRLTGAALFILAAEYLAVEVAGRVPTVSVVAYAAGLSVLCEILFFHDLLRASDAVDRRVVGERLLYLGIVGSGAALIAALVLVAGGRWTFAALEASLAGMAAAVLLCAIPWVLARHGRGRGQKE
jgi:hypothetical protein